MRHSLSHDCVGGELHQRTRDRPALVRRIFAEVAYSGVASLLEAAGDLPARGRAVGVIAGRTALERYPHEDVVVEPLRARTLGGRRGNARLGIADAITRPCDGRILRLSDGRQRDGSHDGQQNHTHGISPYLNAQCVGQDNPERILRYL